MKSWGAELAPFFAFQAKYLCCFPVRLKGLSSSVHKRLAELF